MTATSEEISQTRSAIVSFLFEEIGVDLSFDKAWRIVSTVNDSGGCELLGLFLRDFGGLRLVLMDVGSGDLFGGKGRME